MIQITDKSKCCGCHACTNVCPQKCILMKKDEEGFLYPFVNEELCINCGLCDKVCPEINVAKEQQFDQDGYIVQIKDEKIRRESTAGGAFTAFAQYVIRNGGVVFGATYNEQLQIHHTHVETEDELVKFRNSKYGQSRVGDAYQMAKSFLEDGRLVCFSGTPCQIEGLKSFLRKEYEDLFTVDVVCRAVPSPLVWEKYLDLQREKYGNDIKNILFRDKHYGYKYSTMTIRNGAGNEIYNMGVETDPMLRAFFSNICDRPSCHQCSFKKRYRVSDFTIWDCFPVYDFDKKMDDDKGTTRVLIHTEKGRKLFSSIKENVRWTEVAPDSLVKGVKEMVESVSMNPKRERFFADANVMNANELFNKYFSDTTKVKFARLARVFCYKAGIYGLIKKIYNRLRG